MADASLGTAVLRTKLDTSGLRAGLNQAETQTKQAVSGMSQQLTQLGSQFTKVGTALTVGITAPLTALAGIGIRSAMQLETFSASLRVLVGDVDRANHAFDELYAFDGETLFDWRTLSEATRVLAAYGTEAEDLVPTLRQLGEIAAGTQSDLAGLAEIYGRIQLTGRVTMQEINQLAQRGVPIIQELAAQFGVAEAEVAKLVSSGRVGFPQIQQAVESLTSEGGRFFGMMAAQADTSEGRLSNLRKTFEQVTDIVGQRLLPAFDGIVTRLTGVAQGFLNLDAGTQQTIVNIGMLAAAIGPAVLGIGGLLTAIGKIPAALAAVRAGLLVLSGPAGLLTLAALAAGGLALSLAFRGDSLDAAAEKAAAAFNAGDAKSLSGALDDVIGKFDGELKQALINAQNELHATGRIGVTAMNDIGRAVESLRAQNALNQRDISFLPFAPAVGALNQAGAGMFGDRRMPNAADMVQTALAVGDLEGALATVTQALDVLAGAPRSGAIDALRDLQTQLREGINRVETAEFVPAKVTPLIRTTTDAVTTGFQAVTTAAGQAAATVEGVFKGIENAGIDAERRALALGNTVEAQAESISTRMRALNTGLNDLLVTHGLDPLDDRIQYIVGRLAELNAELERLRRPIEEPSFVPRATEPGGSLPDSLLAPVLLPFRDTPEGIIPALVGEMDPAAIQAARDSLREYQATLEDLGRVGRETATAQRELAAVIADPFGTAIRDAMREQAGRREAQGPIGRSGATGITPEAEFLQGLMAEFAEADRAAEEARRTLGYFGDSLEELARRGREAAVAQREAAQAQAELTATLRAQKEALRAQPYDPFADYVAPLGRSRVGGTGGNAFGGAIEEGLKKQQEAADRFAEVVVNAGLRFTDSLIDAIRSGDIGAAFKAVLGAGQSIIGGMNLGSLSFLGGSIGIAGLISGVLGIIGSLIGGGRSSDEQRRRDMAQQSRSVPAVNINFTMNQENRIEASLAGANLEATMRRVTVTAMEDFWARSGIEARLAKLGV